EAHRLERAPRARELEFQVLVADHALALDLEVVAEERLRKPLAPDLVVEEPRDAQVEVRGLERAVGLDRVRELRWREQVARHGLEAPREALEVQLAQRQPRGGGVAAEAHQQSRLALGEQVERVSQMQAGDRAPRSADLARPGRREREGGPVIAVL